MDRTWLVFFRFQQSRLNSKFTMKVHRKITTTIISTMKYCTKDRGAEKSLYVVGKLIRKMTDKLISISFFSPKFYILEGLPRSWNWNSDSKHHLLKHSNSFLLLFIACFCKTCFVLTSCIILITLIHWFNVY